MSEQVPLPDNTEITIEYNYLLELERQGKKTHLPEAAKGKIEVIIKNLLDGIDFKRNIDKKILLWKK